MEIKFLPIERLNELNALYDMSCHKDFQSIREDNLKNCREICVVAENDGKFIGELSIMTQNANIPAAVVPNKRVYLFGFRVLPEFRGQGIGTRLIQFAVNFCTRRGIFEFTIGVESDNEAAKRLYSRIGFVPFLENCNEIQFGKMCRFDLLMLKLR